MEVLSVLELQVAHLFELVVDFEEALGTSGRVELFVGVDDAHLKDEGAIWLGVVVDLVFKPLQCPLVAL